MYSMGDNLNAATVQPCYTLVKEQCIPEAYL